MAGRRPVPGRGPVPGRRHVIVGGLAAVLAAGCSTASAGSSPVSRAAGTGIPGRGAGTPTGGTPTATATPMPTVTPGPAGSTATSTATANPATANPGAPTAGPVSDVDTSAAAIAGRATVPVLCWHQLRDWTPKDTTYDRNLLVCPPANFRAQLDGLAQAGYTTVTADQYLAHLKTGAALPDKPVMLSFDDSQGTQISAGLPELVKRKMTATFFVMTVPLDKPRWMSKDDVKHLADIGMTVAAHTWDHHRVDRYAGKDWKIQLVEPRAELEKIIGGPVNHFAYPYGAWNTGDFPHLAAAGYETAFQLDVHKVSTTTPLYSIPRILVGSAWSGKTLVKQTAAMVARA